MCFSLAFIVFVFVVVVFGGGGGGGGEANKVSEKEREAEQSNQRNGEWNVVAVVFCYWCRSARYSIHIFAESSQMCRSFSSII